MTAGAPHAGENARRDLVHAAEIAATGGYLPGDLVDNAAYLARCRFPMAHDRAALAETTRMRTRAWCRDGETTFSMALGAVDNALVADPGLKDEIDVVVAVSATTVPGFSPPEREHPGMADLAPLLLRALGRHDALGFDVRAVNCAGFLRGLQIMDGLLANPGYRAGLVVATERCSSLAVGEKNRSAFCYILGDAAGAAVLRRRPRTPGTEVGLIDHVGQMDTRLFHDMTIQGDRASLFVGGAAVGAATVKMLVQCGRQLLQRNQLSINDVDWLLPMQTHAGLVEQARAALRWPAEKLLWRGDVTGFSGSASIPAALAEARATNVIKKGDLVLSLAVGAGLSSAGALYRM